MNAKPKVGDIVECVFLDHVEDSNKPLTFAVYGVLLKDKRRHLVIASWYGQDSDSREEEENQKKWCIIKSCITSLRVLK